MGFKSLINFFSKQKNWPRVFWGLFGISAIISIFYLLNPNPVFTHDNDYETWLGAFDSIFRSGQMFPNWVKSFWFEHGSPLFIFYPPAFFYLAEIPRLLGLSLVISVKIVVILSFLASFFTMYLLGKEFWGKWSGLFAGLLYMTAPYHFALVYIRGAYAENLAYAIFPLILWLIYKVFEKSKNWWYVIGLALSTAFLLLTNLPSTIIFFIIAILFIIGLTWYKQKLPVFQLGLGTFGGLLLSAFYWLPAFLNKGFIQSQYFISENYHFSNYFVSFIDFLPLKPWNNVEYFQWGIMAWIILIIALYLLWRKKQKRGNDKFVWIILILLVISLLLMTSISSSLWASLPIFKYIQFPYRLLSMFFIFLALLGAYVISRISDYYKLVLIILAVIQITIFAKPVDGLRSDLFKSDMAYTVYGDIKSQMIDPDPLIDDAGQKIIALHTTETGYLPKGINRDVIANEFYTSIQPVLDNLSFQAASTYTVPDNQKIITSGKISNVHEDYTSIEFIHEYDEDVKVYYRQFGFPGWYVTTDNQLVEWIANTGQIEFIVPSGRHNVKIQFINPIGAPKGKLISLLSFLALIAIATWLRFRFKNK